MFTEPLDTELEHVLSIATDGSTIDELWLACRLFVEKSDLAKTLNYGCRTKKLWKIGSKYFLSSPELDELLGTPEPVARVVAEPKKAKVTKPRKPSPPKPRVVTVPTKFGELPILRPIGYAAMALYVYQDRLLSYTEIMTIIGRPELKIKTALIYLCESNYIYRRKVEVGEDLYQWSDKFDYPFPRLTQSDLQHLKELPQNYSLPT